VLEAAPVDGPAGGTLEIAAAGASRLDLALALSVRDHAGLGRWATAYGAQQPFRLELRLDPAPRLTFTLLGGLPVFALPDFVLGGVLGAVVSEVVLAAAGAAPAPAAASYEGSLTAASVAEDSAAALRVGFELELVAAGIFSCIYCGLDKIR
jgi:hypothetical protein